MDLALRDRIAVVDSIEQDYEGRAHLGVVIDEDPGRELGTARQPGHRFFFDPQEVEPTIRLGSCPRVLVAGIGNIFLGDDAFGVEVVRGMEGAELPDGVRVVDFGIRGYDLAYALTSGYDLAIFVDAAPRGGSPGDLYLIEPDLASLDGTNEADVRVTDAHSMNPLKVLRMAKTLGLLPARILVLGCEPESLGEAVGRLGLSETVSAAIRPAIERLQSLLRELR
jgi:hydrogenase maturation protease